MYLSYTSASDDSISFYISTSSEQDYDFLSFYIDGIMQDQWSGETPWTRASFPVAAGQHVFKWAYHKDLAYAGGLDRVWADFIALPPPVLPTVDPGPDDTICAGLNVMLQASAQQYDSIRWTSTGDGIFSNDTNLITSYVPGTNDLISGEATLRLTGFGPYGSIGRNKYIRINPLPVAAITVSPRDTVCAGQSILLSTDTAGISTWNWTPGNFSSHEVTYDTANAGGMGVHLIRLAVTNKFQCQNHDSVYLKFKNCTGIEENITGSINIFPNPNNGIFQIEVENQYPGPLHLTITNALSIVVFREDDLSEKSHRRKNINLTFLPDGVYLLSLRTAQGTTSHKLIIRK
jgi:hypothetical protein